MSDAAALIGSLARNVRPVRRLAAPWRRVALWLAGALWVGGLLALFADFGAVWHRLTAVPDLGVAEIGAVLTGVTAALAAFMTSVPGRSGWWPLAPLPPLAVWLGASGWGCLRPAAVGVTAPEGAMHPMACIYFIVLIAAPLVTLLLWQIVRACPLRPGVTAALAGLASAAAAAALLALIHPFDATAVDLGAHFAAVAAVVVGARMAAMKAAVPEQARARGFRF